MKNQKLSRHPIDVKEPYRTILNKWAGSEKRHVKAHLEYVLERAALLYEQRPAEIANLFNNVNGK